MQFDGLILAAGASARMGQPKALLRLDALQGARCLLADQAERLLRAGCDRIVCVLGAQAESIEEARAWEWDRTEPPAAQIVIAHNPQWTLGAFSSLQCGLHALRALRASGPGSERGGGRDRERGAILLPVDVPGVSREVFQRLLDAAGATPAPEAVVPVHGGRGGHPVWLAPATLDRIAHKPPGSRLDHLLRGLRVARIEVADARVALNVNTPEDWRRFVRERA
jgi:molybdenum cofactor cytidylyltransferase